MSPGSESRKRLERLSAREKDCLRLVYAHHTSKSIAIELGFAKSSVDTYINRACAKLGLTDRKEAARLLHEHDLASGAPEVEEVEAVALPSIAPADGLPPSTPNTPVASERYRKAVRQALVVGFFFALASGLMAGILRIIEKVPLLASAVPVGTAVATIMSVVLLATLLRALVIRGVSELATPAIVAAGVVGSIVLPGYGLVHFAIDAVGGLVAAYLVHRDPRTWVLLFAGLSWASAATGAAQLTQPRDLAGSPFLAFVTVYNSLGFWCVVTAAYGVWFARRKPVSPSPVVLAR